MWSVSGGCFTNALRVYRGFLSKVIDGPAALARYGYASCEIKTDEVIQNGCMLGLGRIRE
jgi:hypothetical protein